MNLHKRCIIVVMILRELEKREQLRAEEEARRLDRAAHDEAGLQKVVNRREEVAKEDRNFLEGLKITAYLQTIIDETQSKGVHILWRSLSTSLLRPDEDYIVGVSLVWNIGYTNSVREVVHHSENGNGSTRVSWESGPRDGYAYKSINAYGISKSNSIRVTGRKDEMEPIPTYYELLRFYGGDLEHDYRIPLKYRGPNWEQWHRGTHSRFWVGGSLAGVIKESILTSRYTSISLSGSQLNQPEIKQALALTYLDTEESYAYEKSVHWPFYNTVPEQDQHHILKK